MKKWSLKRHRQASPQLDVTIRHANIRFFIGLILGFILGIITPVWILPLIFEKSPNVTVVLHNTPDPYLVHMEGIDDNSYKLNINTDREIKDLHLRIALPGILENINEKGRQYECEYLKQINHNAVKDYVTYYL